MYKLVPLSDVKGDGVFYMPDLVTKEVMINNSYRKIFFMHYGCSNLYTSVALCKAIGDTTDSETECPTLFDINQKVYIKVPNPKYRDIRHNERFKWRDNEYLKIDSLSEGKILYFSINLSNGVIVNFSREDEVERV